MNQLRDSYSNGTSSNSSISGSSGGLSTPLTGYDGSNELHRTTARASVFDAFYQLGGFEENSPLADWMFNGGGSTTSSEISSSNGPSIRFREQSGSRFRERLGSDSPMFILNNWRDDETKQGSGKKNKTRSKASAPFKTGSTPNRKQNANQPSTIAPTSHQPRRPFSLFRSRKAQSQRGSTALQETTAAVEISNPTKSKRKPPMLRSQTDPATVPMPLHSPHLVDSTATSPASRPSLGDWEKVDPLSTIDFQTLASTENPFLNASPRSSGSPNRPHTADATSIPFPTSSQEWVESSPSPTFMQRLSFIVTKPFRNSHISTDPDSPHQARHGARSPLRRTVSNAPDVTSRPFFMSTPPTAPMHRLKPSVSHS